MIAAAKRTPEAGGGFSQFPRPLIAPQVQVRELGAAHAAASRGHPVGTSCDMGSVMHSAPLFKPVTMPEAMMAMMTSNNSMACPSTFSPPNPDENVQLIYRSDATSPFMPERALGRIMNLNNRQQGAWVESAMHNVVNSGIGISTAISDSYGNWHMHGGGSSLDCEERVEPPFEFCCITPTHSLFTGMTPTPIIQHETPTQQTRETPSGDTFSPNANSNANDSSMNGRPSDASSVQSSPPVGHHWRVAATDPRHTTNNKMLPRHASESQAKDGGGRRGGGGVEELGVGKRKRIPVARDIPGWENKDESAFPSRTTASSSAYHSAGPRIKNASEQVVISNGQPPRHRMVTSVRADGSKGVIAQGSSKKRRASGEDGGQGSNVIKASQVDDLARAKAIKQREEITAVLYKKDGAGGGSDSARKGGKYKGVTWDRAKRMWRVRVCLVGGSRQHIGYYADEEAGAEAYLEALKQLGL